MCIKCEVCGKDITNKTINKAWGMILCCKHYQQKLKYDHFLDNSPYSMFDSNDFEIEGDMAFIILRNKKGKLVGKAIIDKEDLDRCIVKKWRLWQQSVYTGNNLKSKNNRLQFFILGIDSKNQLEQTIDHINGNPLDNRKCNLRICTQELNSVNKAISIRNKSGVQGVGFDKERNKWGAEIRFHNKKCYLGRWNNFCDAVYARYLGETLLWHDYRSNRNDDVISEIIKDCLCKDYIKNYVLHRLKDIYNIPI